MSPTPPTRIVLIGYRGTGKTTVARLLAARLGWSWADTDQRIQRQTGLTIAELFRQRGEAEFRRLEHRVLRALLEQSDPLVVAAGGGVVVLPENRRLLQAAEAAVVWLQAPPEVIAARLEADPLSASSRPSLTGKSIAEEVEQVLDQRRAWYASCSQMAISTQEKTPEEVAGEILRQLDLPPSTESRGR